MYVEPFSQEVLSLILKAATGETTDMIYGF